MCAKGRNVCVFDREKEGEREREVRVSFREKGDCWLSENWRE